MTPASLGLRAGGRFFRFWDNRCIPEAKLHPVLEHLLTSNFFEVNQLNFAEIVCFFQREKLGNRRLAADPYTYTPESNRSSKGF